MLESPSVENLKVLFAHCDADRDGFIDFHDLKTTAFTLDLPVKEDEELDHLFQLMDVNQNQRIGISEFIQALKPIAGQIVFDAIALPKAQLTEVRSEDSKGVDVGFTLSLLDDSFAHPHGDDEHFEFTSNLKIMAKLVEEAKIALTSPIEAHFQRKGSEAKVKTKSEWDEEFEEVGLSSLTTDIVKLNETKRLLGKVFTERMSRYEKERIEMQSNIDTLQKENIELKEKNRKLDSALFQSEEGNVRLKKKCFDVNEALFETNIKVDNLISELQNKEELIKHLKRDFSMISEEKERLQLELGKLEKLNQDLQEKEKKSQAGMRQLDAHLASLQKDLRSDQEEFEKRILLLEEEAKNKSNPDLERALKEIDLLEAQVHELQIRVNRGTEKRQIEPLQAIINSLTVQVSELTDENKALLASLSRLKEMVFLQIEKKNPNQIEENKICLEKANEGELRGKVQGLMEEKDALKGYLDRLLNQIMLREDLLFLLHVA